MLSPLIETQFEKTEKPIIIFAQDNSQSIILNKDSTYLKTEYLKKLNAFTEKLQNDFEVKTYTFDNNLKEALSVDYKGLNTNFQNLFDEINARHFDDNIGAIIIGSDGIINKGINPKYLNLNPTIPIYFLALGDTIKPKDVLINDVRYNKIAFLDNEFPMEIDFSSYGYQNVAVKLKIFHNKEVVFENKYNVSKQKSFIKETIRLRANKPGIQHYRIELSKLKGEITYDNNYKDIYIDVLDTKQKIALITSHPHPDIAAISQVILNKKTYELEKYVIDKLPGNFNPEQYNLIILYQLPDETNKWNAVLNKIHQSKTPEWIILGTKSNYPAASKLYNNFTLTSSSNKLSEVLAIVNNNFPLFIIPENTKRWIERCAPLKMKFVGLNTNKNDYTLLNQKIGDVTTEYPLFIFSEQLNKKQAILFGEGIWKWKFMDYRLNKHFDNFSGLILKTIQFLSLTEEKSRFKVYPVKQRFLQNEDVVFNGAYYNANYELINTNEVELVIYKDSVKKQFLLNKTNDAYKINLGSFSPGYYKYTAVLKGAENSYVDNGAFLVEKINEEALNTVADYALLEALAAKTYGKVIFNTNFDQLYDLISSNNKIVALSYFEKDVKELIHLKWIFFVLLVLITVEWFLRKRFGGY
ncbi:MAG: hypothetical protein Kow0079_02230 [Vicingaceae bacterium]